MQPRCTGLLGHAAPAAACPAMGTFDPVIFGTSPMKETWSIQSASLPPEAARGLPPRFRESVRQPTLDESGIV